MAKYDWLVLIVLTLGFFAMLTLVVIFGSTPPDSIHGCRELGETVPAYQQAEVVKACLESIGRTEEK